MGTRSIVRGLAGVVAAACLAGCETPTLGTTFVRPPSDFVQLGVTTEPQVIARLGKPQEQREFRSDGQLLRQTMYYFGDREAPAHPAHAVCIRVLAYTYSGAAVVGETFASSCAADHTDFDERKADGLVTGSATCADVISVMGRPHARAIHPAVRAPGGQTIGYQFEAMGPGPSYAPTVIRQYSKKLEFTCDAAGVVRDKSFVEEGRL
jgi:hypothetical protein